MHFHFESHRHNIFLYLNDHVLFCGQRREKTAVGGHAKVCDCVFAFVWVCLLAEQVASKDMMGPLSDDTDGELEGWRRMLYAYNNSWSLPVPPALLRVHMSGVRDGVAPKCCLKIRTQIGFNRCDDFHISIINFAKLCIIEDELKLMRCYALKVNFSHIIKNVL